MDVARAQLNRLLQEIVDGANHRRAAGEVAQALDVVLARKHLAGQISRLGHVFAKAAVEYDREIFDRGNLDRDIPTEHDFGGALRCRVGRIGNGERSAAIGRLKRKNRHFPQKPLGKSLVERRCR
jgi:hypothetical protein